jgi:predicted nucleotidyltransferase
MGGSNPPVCAPTPTLAERKRLRRLAAREYAKRAVEVLRPTCVILYGSVARDTDVLDSDVDIVVISDKLPEDILDRMGQLRSVYRTWVPIESLGYTSSEFERMLENRHVTALEALASGRPLHGEAHFNRLRARFDEMVRQGLRRVPGAWTMQAESQ